MGASVILMCFTMIGWIYDDWQLLKALYDFSTHNYEDAELYAKESTIRGLGGRRLLAASILHDIEQEKEQKEEENKVKVKKVPSTLKMVTMHDFKLQKSRMLTQL